MTNVLVWSHKLHHDTVRFLEQTYGQINIVNILHHTENRDLIESEIDAILTDLKAKGVLEGRVVMSLPSTSMATMLAVIGVFRETGVFPDVLNILQCDDGRYRPSKNVPIIYGSRYADRRRKARVG